VRVRNYLDAADTNSTLAAVQALGAPVERQGPGELTIGGVGMLVRAGAPLRRDGARLTIDPLDELTLDAIDVPGDPSSAAFLVAAATLVPGSTIALEDVNTNWTRIGFLRIVERMGGIVRGALEPVGAFSPVEPVARLEVTHGPLRGTVVEGDEVPLAIDELPLVALLACFAEGETVVRDAQELRVKEVDRIDVVVAGLRALGADIEGTPDGFVVRGTGRPARGTDQLPRRPPRRDARRRRRPRLPRGRRSRRNGGSRRHYPGFVDDLKVLLAR
jgi:3-phosphoshikimate 1-carboxyvinyltransferase